MQRVIDEHLLCQVLVALVSIALSDFLDYCSQIGILSTFERDLLIKVKVDGFDVKELLDRHTVLSPKAVYVRVQRIMKRLQEAATTPSSFLDTVATTLVTRHVTVDQDDMASALPLTVSTIVR